MLNELDRILTNLNVKSIPPHPVLANWDGRMINDIDWVGEGVVLYYNHNAKTDTGAVFDFVGRHTALLKRKKVSRVYIESEAQVKAFDHYLQLNNDKAIARELSKGNNIQYRATLARLTMVRKLRDNGIKLYALQHGTREGELPSFLTWYKTDIIDRDLKSVEYIKENHKCEENGPIVALVGVAHALFGLKLNLPGIFIANEMQMKQLDLQLQPGKMRSGTPRNFYPLQMYHKAISIDEELERVLSGSTPAYLAIMRKALNHRDELTKHFALLLTVRPNEDQRHAISLMAFILVLLAMAAYYCLRYNIE